MEHILRTTLQVARTPLLCQQACYSAKINLKRPRAPNFRKALIEKFVAPVYYKPSFDMSLVELCKKNVPKKQLRPLNPYERIIAREAAERFRNSQMVAFFHRNSINMDKLFDFQVRLKKHNMVYKVYSYPITLEALKQANLEAAQPLIRSPFGLVFSEEINVPALKRAAKKTPQLFLLGGVLQNQLVDLDDFLKYGSMSLPEVQSGLVSVLQNAGGMNLARQLTQHQTTFIDRLTAIQNRSSENPDKAPDKE